MFTLVVAVVSTRYQRSFIVKPNGKNGQSTYPIKESPKMRLHGVFGLGLQSMCSTCELAPGDTM